MKRIDTRGRFRDEPPRGLRVRLTGEGMSVAMGSPSAEDEGLAIVRGKDLDALQRRIERLTVAARWLDDAAASWFSSEYIEHPKRKALRDALDEAMGIVK